MTFIVIGGIYQYLQLPVALYPRTTKPEITARFRAGSMSGKELMERYGEDIEASLNNIKGVEKVEGRYRRGRARFTITFGWGIDPDEAENDVHSVVSRFEGSFPDYFSRFRIYLSGQHSSFFYAALMRDQDTSTELTHKAKTAILPRLRAIKGIEGAWIGNRDSQAITITADPDQILQYGISYDDILDSLKKHEFDRSLGDVPVDSGEDLRVRAQLTYQSIDEIKNTIIAVKSGHPVRLSQVATVEIEQKPSERVYKLNGKQVIGVAGVANPTANLRNVAKEFLETLQSEAKRLDSTLKTKILLDPSSYIDAAIRNVIIAVLAGIMIATGIVLLFLRSIASTLVICLAIPLSLIGGFVLMRFFGIEINLISLGAMALAVGMTVDGAVVMLENIVRHWSEKNPRNSSESFTCIVSGMREVRAPIIASILTTVIVFIPLPFTSPITAAILGDLAAVMVCTLVMSLAVTLLFLPALIYLFRKRLRSLPRLDDSKQDNALSFRQIYLNSLSALLSRKPLRISILAIVLALFTTAVWLAYRHIPREILGMPETKVLFMDFNFNAELPLDERVKIVDSYEQRVKNHPKLNNKLSYVFSEIRQERTSNLWIFAKNKKDYPEIQSVLESEFPGSPLVEVYVSSWSPSSLHIDDPPDIKIISLEPDLQKRRESLNELREILKKTQKFGATDIKPGNYRDTFLDVDVNLDKLSGLESEGETALSPETIYQFISSSLQEQPIYDITMNGIDYPLTLQLPLSYRKSLKNLGNLLLRINDEVIPLRSVARISEVVDWADYYSEDGQITAFIRAWKRGNDSLDSLKYLVKDKIRQSNKINSEMVSFVDTQQEITENLQSLISALVLSLFLIWIVVSIQFASVRQSLLIMIAVPLGFIGVSTSLWVFDSMINLNSLLGLILLGGTAVNNSIIFVDFYNRLKSSSQMSTVDAIVETASLRIRPIMITTLTTILGMIPIALGIGSGSEVLQPLGIAVSGGLWISTLLTIYLVPLGIFYLDNQRSKN